MQVEIDKFGRMLIPKEVRDHLGLKAGTVLQLIEQDHEILLKLPDQKTLLQQKNGVLVYLGEATSDIDSALSEERKKRLEDLSK